jgi:sulfate adenylyltransferase subunit 1
MSSLYGRHVVTRSPELDWYQGPTLLEFLENVRVDDTIRHLPARFPVQYVIRPKTDEHHDFRGYAGKVASGRFETGDEVVVLPTMQKSRIKTIEKFREHLPAVYARESVTITLEDDLDISRGNMLVKADAVSPQQKEFKAAVCWMDHQPLTGGKTLLVQHGINQVKAKIVQVLSVTDVKKLQEQPDKNIVNLNDIGTVLVKTARPLFADAYKDNPPNGAFILIDEHTNSTVGVGFIQS